MVIDGFSEKQTLGRRLTYKRFIRECFGINSWGKKRKEREGEGSVGDRIGQKVKVPCDVVSLGDLSQPHGDFCC